jgi:hypothetical protein
MQICIFVTFILCLPADCPPGSYGTLEKGVATCNICPRGSYQRLPGQTSCIKCPHGFITADKGARDHSQCKGISVELGIQIISEVE